MDRLDEAGLSWHLYAPSSTQGFGYGWAICPTFAECLNGPQAQNVVPPSQFSSDAAAGTLPSLSILIPVEPNSQHNHSSMLAGDNWIAGNVAAVMNGPDWSSTAIFIAYDDCGCFYDHVPPPDDLGIRVPMVIVSQYARSGYTDSTVASFDSLLAFTEHTFGLTPLSPLDASAYDYANSFNYAQAPLGTVRLVRHPVSPAVLRKVAESPPDPNDPT
jgi:phospholipase C